MKTWLLSRGVPDAEALFNASERALDEVVPRKVRFEGFELTEEDCRIFGNLIHEATHAVTELGLPTWPLDIEVTPTDTRSLDIRRDEAGADVGDPHELNTPLPMVRAALRGDEISVGLADDDDEKMLDQRSVMYVVNEAEDSPMDDEVADRLEQAGWVLFPGRNGAIAPDWLASIGYGGEVRENPDGDGGVQEMVDATAPDAAAPAERGSVVKKMDAGMELAIEKAVAGDADGVAAVWKRYYPYVRKMAYKYMASNMPISPTTGKPKKPSADEANEVATITMNRLLYGTDETTRSSAVGGTPAIRRYRLGSNAAFATYLVGIVKHVAQERHRAYGREQKAAAKAAEEQILAQAAPDLDDPDAILDPEQAYEQRERQAEAYQRAADQGTAIEAGFGQLSDDEKRVLQARAQGLTYKQMAQEIFGDSEKKSVQKVMVRLHRARKHLEEASGEPIRGLVGKLGEMLGMKRQGRPRKNPDDEILFVETLEDLCELCDVGVIDGACYQQCLAEWLTRGYD